MAYGTDPDHVGDLRIPQGAGPHRVAVLIHGGFWRDHWTRDLMDGAAADLVSHGFATWNIEYRRVGNGGGWPATLEDVGHAIDHLSEIAPQHDLDLDDVTVIGHSAGGHLAHWAAGRQSLPEGAPGSSPRVVSSRTIGLAPVFDLAAAHERNLGDGAVESFLRRGPGDQRYSLASPHHLQPLAGEQHIVHGSGDEAVPIELSLDSGIPVVVLEGVDHFALIDPSHQAWAAVVDLLD
ncbi:MAG: alpha/beta hydrolase [Acidimicrobiia bacterium]|nr:alpha/beta hydrolase [Acidimicrobiia bacterium]NNF62887.1 alpha/beta hydrolase [Acidimicrobiia bacterium]